MKRVVGLRVVSSARNTSISRLLSVSSMKSNALLMRSPAASTKGEIFETSALYARSMAWNATSPSVAFSSMHCAAKPFSKSMTKRSSRMNFREAVPDSIFLASLRSRSDTRGASASSTLAPARNSGFVSRSKSRSVTTMPSWSSAFEQSADSVSIIRPRSAMRSSKGAAFARSLMDGVAVPERIDPT